MHDGSRRSRHLASNTVLRLAEILVSLVSRGREIDDLTEIAVVAENTVITFYRHVGLSTAKVSARDRRNGRYRFNLAVGHDP